MKPNQKRSTQENIDVAAQFQLLDTPLGTLRLISDGCALNAIEFEGMYGNSTAVPTRGAEAAVLNEAARQLSDYFDGKRTAFSLPLRAGGTAFQHSVWQALQDIPYGEVRSYRDIAVSLGKDKAVRAVGAANGRNPLPIVVPCHRVIGSDGSLTGFAGGLEAKTLLLTLEGAL